MTYQPSSISSVQSAGVGLRIPHFDEIIEKPALTPWVEIMADNWLSDGGLTAQMLDRLQGVLPISVHGVGLSLGGMDPLDENYLQRISSLLQRSKAMAYSEHLSFSSFAGEHFPDLLPLPFTEESLIQLSGRINQTQDFLNQQILIENISAYVSFKEDEISEGTFIAELVHRTGCGVLLDVNNLYVNHKNLGRDPWQQIMKIPKNSIQEIHLAGFSECDNWLVDTHSTPVCDGVWQLYNKVLHRLGPIATLIEWDSDLPSFDILDGERKKAQNILQQYQLEPA